MDMPQGFLQTFPNWILPSLRPAQGFSYLSPEKVQESFLEHYNKGANHHGPGILIFDGMGLPIEYRTNEGIALFNKRGIFEEIEGLEPIIIQGVHRTAAAIETRADKYFFVLSSQPHTDYLLKIAQGKFPEPDGWNYSAGTLRILPKNFREINKLPFYKALNRMEDEYKTHADGWTMDDFVEELNERFP